MGVLWDMTKDESNVRAHGLSLAEGISLLGDPLGRSRPDPDHSVGEARFIRLGRTTGGLLATVAYSDHGDQVRIISVRRATRHERRAYERDVD